MVRIEEEAEELKGSNEAEEARIERQLAAMRAPSKYFNESAAPMMLAADIIPLSSHGASSSSVPSSSSRVHVQPVVYEWQYRQRPSRPLTISSQVVHLKGYLDMM